MPNTCFVYGCNSGYHKQPSNTCDKEKVTMFRAPKDRVRLIQWKAAIPRPDRIISNKDFVCSKHFEEVDIIKDKRYPGKDGEIIIPRLVWKLQPNAIPKLCLGICYLFC